MKKAGWCTRLYVRANLKYKMTKAKRQSGGLPFSEKNFRENMIALDIRPGLAMGEDIRPVGGAIALGTNVPIHLPTRTDVQVDCQSFDYRIAVF